MPTVVRVTVDDTSLAREFLPGGDGWNWLERVGREQMFHTLMMAPVRSGALKSSFNLAVTPNGALHARYSVGSFADHAYYVVLGTTPPIYGDGNYMGPGYPLMKIRAAPHSWSPHPFTKRFVDGQEANNFFERAAFIILAKYG